MHVAIILYDGFDELDAVAPFEVFQNAGAAGADCEAELVALDDREFTLHLGSDAVAEDERLGVPDDDAVAAAVERAREEGAPEAYLDQMDGVTGLVAEKRFDVVEADERQRRQGKARQGKSNRWRATSATPRLFGHTHVFGTPEKSSVKVVNHAVDG